MPARPLCSASLGLSLGIQGTNNAGLKDCRHRAKCMIFRHRFGRQRPSHVPPPHPPRTHTPAVGRDRRHACPISGRYGNVRPTSVGPPGCRPSRCHRQSVDATARQASWSPGGVRSGRTLPCSSPSRSHSGHDVRRLGRRFTSVPTSQRCFHL